MARISSSLGTRWKFNLEQSRPPDGEHPRNPELRPNCLSARIGRKKHCWFIGPIAEASHRCLTYASHIVIAGQRLQNFVGINPRVQEEEERERVRGSEKARSGACTCYFSHRSYRMIQASWNIVSTRVSVLWKLRVFLDIGSRSAWAFRRSATCI